MVSPNLPKPFADCIHEVSSTWYLGNLTSPCLVAGYKPKSFAGVPFLGHGWIHYRRCLVYGTWYIDVFSFWRGPESQDFSIHSHGFTLTSVGCPVVRLCCKGFRIQILAFFAVKSEGSPHSRRRLQASGVKPDDRLMQMVQQAQGSFEMCSLEMGMNH